MPQVTVYPIDPEVLAELSEGERRHAERLLASIAAGEDRPSASHVKRHRTTISVDLYTLELLDWFTRLDVAEYEDALAEGDDHLKRPHRSDVMRALIRDAALAKAVRLRGDALMYAGAEHFCTGCRALIKASDFHGWDDDGGHWCAACCAEAQAEEGER